MIGNYNIEDDNQEPPCELDNEFILRLPPEPAATLRSAIRAEEKHRKNKFQIQIDPDMRHAVVKFDKWILPARVHDLPTIIESYKTLDRKVFYKVGEVCQIMTCQAEDLGESEEDSPTRKYDRNGREKKYLFNHGITAPLKNVRKSRFRRTMRKKFTEGPTVEKEVRILLKTDSEAISSRFELVEEDKIEDHNDPASTVVNSENAELKEYDIFGEVSSSSDDSEEESQTFANTMQANGITSHVKDEEQYIDVECDKTPEKVTVSLSRADDADENDIQHAKVMYGKDELDNKVKLYSRLTELEEEIANIQSQRLRLEANLLTIDNSALRQRLEASLASLTAEEQNEQQEYEQLKLILQPESLF